MATTENPKKNLGNYLHEVLTRKEKYLLENAQYRKFENLHHRRVAGKYIGDVIYGANDGIITTFAVIAGASGASLAPAVVIILGFANLVADGISMGASNYLGKRSEHDYAKAQREKEEWEIDHLKEIEVEEVREIFEKKGFHGEDLDKAVEIVTSDRKVWLDTMMRDELNIYDDGEENIIFHGFATFLAFAFFGLIPLLPYLVPTLENRFLVSALLGILTLFLVGASRSIITTLGWIRGGIEMLAVGSIAALVAYVIGAFIETLTK